MTTRRIRHKNLKLALRADSGLALGALYPLARTRNLIGRSVDVGVPVDDTKVSRVHAAIDTQNGIPLLVDLGSTNGTYLNGERLETSTQLKPGDQIRVGSQLFVVEILDHAKTQVSEIWRETTRAILKSSVAQPAEPQVWRNEIGHYLRSLTPRLQKAFFENGHWIVLIVVFLALMMGMASTFKGSAQ